MTVAYGSTKNGNSSTYTWRAYITYVYTNTYSATASRFQFQNIGVDRVKTSGSWSSVYFTNRSCTAGGTSMINLSTQVTLSWASGNGDNKTLTASTKNVDFTRGCADTTKAVSFSVKHKESGNTSTGSFNVTVPARALYTVTFNGNNGTVDSGANVFCANCSGNHKSYGYEATISATATRAGYIFTGWNTAADGTGTAYVNGGKIAADTNANLTLYAQWRPANYVKVNGVWKDVTAVYVKVEGVWKSGTILPIPDN